MTTTTLTKAQICDMLDAWIRQRPGLEFGNYGDVSAYRAELRSITRDLRDARTLLSAVRGRDSITADMLRAGFRAYSGRLSLADDAKGRAVLSYCTGQYWPTEYRRAACAVLSSVLWDYFRDHCMPAPMTHDHQGNARYLWRGNSKSPDAISAGDWLRKTAQREFGRGIASRWFN